jgi:hypothetical protein
MAHEGVALRDNRPEAFHEAFLPSSGPGDIRHPQLGLAVVVVDSTFGSIIPRGCTFCLV